MINTTEVKKASRVLRALNHKLREKILETIEHKYDNRVMVSDLFKFLKLEQSVCSQHLAILRREGIVKTERDGKCIYYSVNHMRVMRIMELCGELLKH